MTAIRSLTESLQQEASREVNATNYVAQLLLDIGCTPEHALNVATAYVTGRHEPLIDSEFSTLTHLVDLKGAHKR